MIQPQPATSSQPADEHLISHHPDTLASASKVADILRELGEYERARELNEDTLARQGQVLGEDHPDTLASSNLAAELQPLDSQEPPQS